MPTIGNTQKMLIIGGFLLYRKLSSNAIKFLPDGVFATMTKLKHLYVKQVFITLVVFEINDTQTLYVGHHRAPSPIIIITHMTL